MRPLFLYKNQLKIGLERREAVLSIEYEEQEQVCDNIRTKVLAKSEVSQHNWTIFRIGS